MRRRARVAADRRGHRPQPQQSAGLLRAARQRGRRSLRDLAQRSREAGAARGGAARRRRSRDRRRARLLPGRRPGLAELLLPRHPHPPGRRGGPAGPARGAAQAAQGRGALRAAEAAGAAAAAEDDRGRHRGEPARPAATCSPGSSVAAGRAPWSGPSRRCRTATRRRRSPRRSRTSPRSRRSRRSSSPAAAAASPTSGPSATRRSAARSRCCACRWSAPSATSATRP